MTYDFPKSMTIKQAVISTLAYFDLFDVPLTREEIYENLFFLNPDQRKIDMYLKESPLIHIHDGYFSLKRNAAFYQHFEGKRRRSKEFWKKVKRWQWIFAICPYVKMVGVVNSLPIRAVEQNSDIDLLIITEKEKMFTARFFTTLLTSLFLVRRHGKFIRKKFCLSFFTTESNLDFSHIKKDGTDIYLAYWIKTLEPITGDYPIYEKFLKNNRDWLKPYFAHLFKRRRRFRRRKPWQVRIKGFLERRFCSPKWEIRMQNWQMRRAMEKCSQLEDQSGTIIKKNMLKFHDLDLRDQIKRDWFARINEFM
jgi:hypothetical protein